MNLLGKPSIPILNLALVVVMTLSITSASVLAEEKQTQYLFTYFTGNGEEYLVYYDAYRDRHYSASRSRDLKTWEDVTQQMTFVPGMRHGTVIAVTADAVARLRRENPAQ